MIIFDDDCEIIISLNTVHVNLKFIPNDFAAAGKITA